MSLVHQLMKTEINKLPDTLCQKVKATDDGKKFSLLLLKKLSGKTDSEIIDIYTEGGGDHQIDGVYLENDGDLLIINIITCKYFLKRNDHIPDKDITDFLRNGLVFLLEGEDNVSNFSHKLLKLKEDIDEEKDNYKGNFEVSLKFIATSNEVLSAHGRNAVNKYICDAEKSNIQISY